MDVSRPTPRPSTRSRLAPWVALIAALSGEAFHHQALSDMLRYDCRLGDGRLFLFVGLAVIAWMLVGAVVSWRAVRGGDEAEGPRGARRFIAHVGILAALLLSIAVAWQTFAGFVVPACAS